MNASADSIAAFSAQVSVFLTSAQEKAQDGLTWSEFGRLFVELINLVVRGLDAITSLTGPQKREVAIAAVATLFDTFADKCVPIVAWPAWLIIRPAVRLLLLSMAAGAVEALLKISRSADA